MFLYLTALLGVLSLALLAHAESVIVSGTTWYDTSGNSIQAHGAGIFQVGSTYYWVGEDKIENSTLFHAVSCYSSTDLINWTRQNNALSPVAGTYISSNNVVERPKVIYNSNTKQYVMWFHSDSSNYGLAMVGVAVSSTPCGPYEYISSWKPLGADSRDEGLFLDDNGDAYLLYASDNNQNFKITQLNSSYTNVTTMVAELSGATLEAPGIVKRNGTYYLFASHTSGWAPNPNKWFSASSISGTWSSQEDIAPEDTDTYQSQNAYDLPLGSNAIYMGDRWVESALGTSTYTWYPLSWSSGSPQIVYADVWAPNLSAGTYTIYSGTTYHAVNGTLSGSAEILTNSAYSDGEAVGYLGNGGSVTLNNVQGNGQGGQWVSLYYANGDSSYRNCTVSVNGGANVVVQQPPSGGGHVILSVPVKLNLKEGSNSITFAADQTNYAGDLDRIIIYNVS